MAQCRYVNGSTRMIGLCLWDSTITLDAKMFTTSC